MTKKYIIEMLDEQSIAWLEDNLAILSIEEITDKKYQIDECCPDKDLAIEGNFITIRDKTAYIKLGRDWWDLDYCPFCGTEIRVSTRVRKEVSE